MISDKLLAIQTELKAPKTQRNTYGNYNYRSCEDILELVKPLLLKHSCTLWISDELVNIGDRYYIKATVTLRAKTANDVSELTIHGYAREAESQKGFDQMQLTGSTSSYARKYALNGMFLIDDTKDSDVTNKHGKDNSKGKDKTTKKADESVLQQIKNSKTVDELEHIYSTLTTEEQPLYLDKFSTRKAIIKANEYSKAN